MKSDPKLFWIALSGRNNLFGNRTEGVAPGYDSSGLQPRLKGGSQRSRGQRPRYGIENIFCPKGAHQIILVYIYAAIIACSKRAHHFFDQRTASFADARYSR